MSACTAKELAVLLENNSTKKHYMFVRGYRTNHLAHGAIAIARLGGSLQRIQQYVNSYSRRLENPKDHSAENQNVSLSIEELKGQEQSFYVLLDHYLKILKKAGSLEDFIAGEFPKLIPGMLGAAFHGMIQMGYGFSADNERIVAEGFAYLHHSYLPLELSAPADLAKPLGNPGSSDILNILKIIKENQDFADLASTGKDRVSRRAGVLLAERGNELVQYVNRIKLPEFYDANKSVASQKDALLKWLVDCSILVYVMAKTRNDFFLLHGVTGAWSLKVVLSAVDDSEQITRAVRAFLCGLFAVYVAQGSPALCTRYLPVDDTSASSWEEIIEKTLNTEKDTHIYKLVQVCHNMDLENTDSSMTAVYKEACDIALVFPLAFGPY